MGGTRIYRTNDASQRVSDSAAIGENASKAIGGSGLRLTNGERIWPGVEVNGGAFTHVVMSQINSADATSRTLLTGDTHARVSQWAVQRLGSGFWTTNSLGLYRHQDSPDNQDLVWTSNILVTQSTGLATEWIGKPFAGGAGNE